MEEVPQPPREKRARPARPPKAARVKFILDVIPGRCKASNPESRASGFASRPGMTETEFAEIQNTPLHLPSPPRPRRPYPVRSRRLHPCQGAARPGPAGAGLQHHHRHRTSHKTMVVGGYLAGGADRGEANSCPHHRAVGEH